MATVESLFLGQRLADEPRDRRSTFSANPVHQRGGGRFPAHAAWLSRRRVQGSYALASDQILAALSFNKSGW
jgi:hypothetical protein